MDPRKRKTSGFAPSAMVVQWLFTLTSGGRSIADAERLGRDQVLIQLIGLAGGADESTHGELLRAQARKSVLEFVRLNTEFVPQRSGFVRAFVRACAGSVLSAQHLAVRRTGSESGRIDCLRVRINSPHIQPELLAV